MWQGWALMQAARRIGWDAVPLVAFAVACGAGAFASGLYRLTAWAPLELGLLVIALALTLARPTLPSRRSLVAAGALVGLSAWAWLSRGWGDSADAALITANRLMLYAAMLVVLSLVVRGRAHASLLVGAMTAAVLVMAAYLLARMLAGDGPDLFVYGRLNEPIGYVNGQAGFLLLGLWPLLALAERESVLSSSLGAAGAAVIGCLLVLSQSRGVALAVAVSAVMALAVVPGRHRRLWALVVAGGAVASVLGPLLDVHNSAVGPRSLPEETVRDAALAAVLAAFGAAAVWGAARAAAGAIAARGPAQAARLRRASTLALAALAGACLLVGLVSAGAIADRARDEYDAFVSLEREPTGSRFFAGGGNRYDFWRIALLEFRAEPLRGVGGGNYDVGYFERRRTMEDVNQPHSLALQTLAELGLVGAALLAAFFGVVLWGLVGMGRTARGDPWSRTMAVAAGGAFIAWTVHTNVDWVHLLPAVMGVVLAYAVVLLRPWEGLRPPASGRPAVRLAGVAVLAAAVALAGVSVAAPAWSEHLREQGRNALRADPAQALRKADDALALNSDSVPAYYLKAAALARLDAYGAARASLLEAARREPGDFVTWGLLGDLALRRGDSPLAARYYRRAVRLNPGDRYLRAQARRAARGG